MADSPPNLHDGLKPLVLTFDDGTSETVLVESEFCQRLEEENDEDFARSVVEGYREAYRCSETLVKEESSSTPQPSPESEETTWWKHEAVLLLISLYGEHKDKFDSPSYEDKDIWEMISQQMKANGFSFGGIQCDHKFRYLQHRYKVIVDSNQGKNAPNKEMWHYFSYMHKIMNGESAADDIQAALNAIGLVWEHEAVILLISLYSEHRDKFESPNFKQKDVWEMINQQMKGMGYNFGGARCNEKFRSLKHRYKLIVDSNRGKNTPYKRRWQYLSRMHKVLSGESAVDGEQSAVKDIEAMVDEQDAMDGETTVYEESAMISHQRPTDLKGIALVWEHEAVILLISLYSEHRDKFKSPNIKQKDVWEMINQQMEEMGFYFGATRCNEKFRCLKHRYKIIVESNGGKSIPYKKTWQYFSRMHKVLSGESAGEMQSSAKDMGAMVDEQDGGETTVGEENATIPHQRPTADPKGILWEHEAVLLLISLYGEHRDKFYNPYYRQKDVWDTISQQMKEIGYSYSGECCNQKFRSLKHRHKIISTSTMTSDDDRPIWPYFSLMEEMLSGDTPVPRTFVVKSEIISQSNEAVVSEQSEIVSCQRPDTESKEVGWRQEEVLLLISLIKEHNDKFSSPLFNQKKEVWEIISQEMRDAGYGFDWNQCYKKFTSLKHRYGIILSSKSKNIRTKREWQYYSYMEDLMGGDTAVQQACGSTSAGNNESGEETAAEDQRTSTYHPNVEPKELLWTREAVFQLISLYKESKDKFTSGSMKELWEDISKQLKDMGHNYEGTHCDNKIRVLKHRYKVIANLDSKTTTWPFYNHMHDLMCGHSGGQLVVNKIIVPKKRYDRKVKGPNTSISHPSFSSKDKGQNSGFPRPRYSSQDTGWRHEAVKLLISLYKDHKDKFESPFYKQINVWEMISQQIKDMGYKFDGLHCYAKFRSLKYRYKNIIARKRTRKWPYFSDMDEILNGTLTMQAECATTSTQECQNDHIDSVLGDSSLTPVCPITSEIRHNPPTQTGRNPPTQLLESISSLCYMPLTPPLCSEPLTPQPSPSPLVTQESNTLRTPVTFSGSSRKRKANELPVSTPLCVPVESGGSSSKRIASDTPEWVKTFVETSNERFGKLEEATNKLIVVEERRNELLEELINHLKNKT